MHVITVPAGPVTPVGIEQRVEVRRRRSRQAAAVGVGPAGTQQIVVDRRAGATARPGTVGRADAGGPVRGCRRRTGRRRAGHRRRCRSTSGTPPRSTGAGWRAGPDSSLAGERAGPAVKVLVTGASSLLGGGVARRWPARRHVTVLQRRPAGSGWPRSGATSPTGEAVRRGGRAARTSSCTWPRRSRGRARGRSSCGPTSPAPANVVAALSAVRGVAPGARVVPSVAHAGASLVGAGAGPRRSRPRARALRAQQGDGRADRPGRRRTGARGVAIRPHLVWGPGDTQLVARIVERARRGRLPVLGSGARPGRHARTSTTPSTHWSRPSTVVAIHGAGAGGHQRRAAPHRRAARRHRCRGRCATSEPARPDQSRAARGIGGRGALGVRARGGGSGEDDPPMTRFLAEQLSTAHWFDQRRTRSLLGWSPRVGLDEGFARLRRSYGLPPPARPSQPAGTTGVAGPSRCDAARPPRERG